MSNQQIWIQNHMVEIEMIKREEYGWIGSALRLQKLYNEFYDEFGENLIDALNKIEKDKNKENK